MKKYLDLVKPGIIVGNIITLSGGYFLAASGHFYLWHFLATLIGMSCVIACGCVLNNCFDSDIDARMHRTQDRLLACGLFSIKLAMGYAVILGLIGFVLFYIGTNPLTACIAFIGLFTYVVAYTAWFKRSSVFGTLIGAVAGAVPPVIGYTAVTNAFDIAALILFLILFCWQIPHFFAIAICYKEDYARAKIPLLPLKRSMRYTKVNMLVFTILFFMAAVILYAVSSAGLLYLIMALLIGMIWLLLAIKGFWTKDDKHWARLMFIVSIIGITLLSLAMIF